MKNESLKEVVKKMCCAMPGGREALAGALGMSLTTTCTRRTAAGFSTMTSWKRWKT